MFFPLLDWTIVLLIPAIVLSLYAQMKVSSTFNRFSQVMSARGLTGAAVAKEILRQNGIFDVVVERVPGNLSDHYDPRARALRLSDPVYGSSSLAAIGVAAHEAGHAIQHEVGYVPIGIRSAIVPVAQFGSNLSMPLLLFGIFLGSPLLAKAGVLAFAAVVVFQLVTLPVEFNASSRAIAVLAGDGYLNPDEIGPTRKVLNAAALTYVAAALMGILNLIRLLIISGLLGNRDDG